MAIALKFANGKLVFALSPSLRLLFDELASEIIGRPASAISACVWPITFCDPWPLAIAVKVSEDYKIVVLKSAVNINFFNWKTFLFRLEIYSISIDLKR